MTSKLLDLSAMRRSLGAWISGGEVQAFGENSSQQLNMNELANLLGANYKSSAGVPVTAETAMRVSAVYACVSLISGAIGSLPFEIYERDGRDRKLADNHDYWWMFNEMACDGWTTSAAWEAMFNSKLLHGDGLAQFLRPSPYSNRVIGWKPLLRQEWQPFRDYESRDKEVYYRITPIDGSPSYVLRREDVAHLNSQGFDGLESPSPITYAAREAVGAALAAQEYSGKFFAGGGTFDYALKTAAKMDKAQLEQLKASLLARVQNGGRGPLILGGGLEPAQLTINQKDAEVLATRLFNVEEICSILGVPPYMIGHTTKATSFGTGIEQQGIGFNRYTLRRHVVGASQEFSGKLWPVRTRYFAGFDTDELERADMKSRYEAYRIGLGRAGEKPWLTQDEIRRREKLPPDANLTVNEEPNGQPTD